MISKLLRMECVKISTGRTGEREGDTKSSIFRDGEIKGHCFSAVSFGTAARRPRVSLHDDPSRSSYLVGLEYIFIKFLLCVYPSVNFGIVCLSNTIKLSQELSFNIT